MTALRVFFYVQHLLGIGHLARASRIASALAEDGFDVTVVTGGLAVPGFPGSNVKSVALPAVVASNAGFSGLADEQGKPVDEAFLHHRRDLLLQAFHRVQPDIVIIEAFPFGRRQMRFELLPLLDAIQAATPRPKLLTSVRDILQERAKPGRDQETVALINGHFDNVLVHGDPGFVALPDTFPLAGDIAGKIVYTGLVAGPVAPIPTDIFDIVVSAGGGAVGLDLVRSALEAARTSHGKWCVITGPNLPETDFAALSDQTPDNVALVRFRRDFPSLLRGRSCPYRRPGTIPFAMCCRRVAGPFLCRSLRAAKLNRQCAPRVWKRWGWLLPFRKAA